MAPEEVVVSCTAGSQSRSTWSPTTSDTVITPAGQRRQMRSGIGSALAGGVCRCPPLTGAGGGAHGVATALGWGRCRGPRRGRWGYGWRGARVRSASGSLPAGRSWPAPEHAITGARNQWRAPGPPHPCGGDIGMVAEFLRHPCGAALRAKRQDRL
jgi:hypothetical protein